MEFRWRIQFRKRIPEADTNLYDKSKRPRQRPLFYMKNNLVLRAAMKKPVKSASSAAGMQ